MSEQRENVKIPNKKKNEKKNTWLRKYNGMEQKKRDER